MAGADVDAVVRFVAVFFAVPEVLLAVPDADVFAVLFLAVAGDDVVFDVLLDAVLLPAVPDVPVFFAAVLVVDFFLAVDLDDVLDADLAAVARFVGADAEVVVRAVVVLAALFFAAVVVVVAFGIFLAPDT